MTDDLPGLQTFTYRPGLALDYMCSATPPAALVVYAHGGSFMTGNRKDRLARHFATLLPGMGVAFASIDYRKRGKPWRDLGHDLGRDPAAAVRAGVEAAEAQSHVTYPEVPERLFGPLLYRATQDFGAAVDWLRASPDGPCLGDLPVIVAGLSAGGIAAMGLAHGLDGVVSASPAPMPSPVLALASLPCRRSPGGSGRIILAARRCWSRGAMHFCRAPPLAGWWRTFRRGAAR